MTMRLLNTKQDMRNGRKTGTPVSGWRVESHSFLAAQRSGVMAWGRSPAL